MRSYLFRQGKFRDVKLAHQTKNIARRYHGGIYLWRSQSLANIVVKQICGDRWEAFHDS